MLEDAVLYVDADTACVAAACTRLFLLMEAVLATWPRPRYDGVLLPAYATIIIWGTS